MPNITKTFLDKLQPPATGYKLHWDDDVSGFGVRSTAGGKLTFIVQGRVLGKELRHTIGSFDHWTIKTAREEAQDVIVGMNKGIDRCMVKRAKKAAQLSLQTVADEYTARPGKLKTSSKEAIERHIRTTFAGIKNKPITEITEDYCRRRYREMLTSGPHGDRAKGSPGQANQALSILKALLNYSVRQHQLITANPVVCLKDDWNKLPERTSYIIPSRVGAVWNWLTTQRESAIATEAVGAFDLARFLLLTGARLDEALTLQWVNVRIEDDINECFWHLPDPKNRQPSRAQCPCS